ncbi:hypothetical protein [Lacisediminihabitans changchengi]|uniref:PBP domain-containing protein n=1 Tax=Lacisediminihabitans changchengi TaxID=2787634 RepID=A0A934SNE1_9MICO|nr:hypothetical protein [Lacisediminihabitans changchengi]MBK4348611.1 hypothetical protein [Lacisediminihabitans changchengi]
MLSPSKSHAQKPWLASVVVGLLVALVVGGISVAFGTGAPSATASDSSAVTITAKQADDDLAHAPMKDLSVTIAQTKDLVAQGLQISWTGAEKSTQPATDNGGENFLQIMQCWGDDPAVAAGQPAQPDRTTCQYGGFLTPGATRDNFVTDDEVAPQDDPFTAPGDGFAHPTYTSIPFRAPSGKVIASVVNHVKLDTVDPNTNEFFTAYSSNEVKWAGSSADGKGSVKFEVQTAQQSSGIDCGAKVVTTGAAITGKSCWIVVVPRGTQDAGESHIVHSGLFWDAWKHRIAFRVNFKPIGINCPIGSAEKQISGSELVAGAVGSWQPVLCAGSSGSIFTISTGAEPDALRAASDPAVPAALALTSRALDTSDGSPDPDVYAPIALSGISVAFAIDRRPLAGPNTDSADLAKANQAFSSMKLTPRLIAKLLTNSYLDSLPGDKSDIGYHSPANPGHNARNLTTDPDFLAINDPEWKTQALVSPSLADLLVPQGRSDVAFQLWRYVMADQEGRDFVAGKPDAWGMFVNPWNSTDASINPAKVGLSLPMDSFPKSDPAEVPAVPNGAGALNLVTWRPYTNDLDTGGYLTLRGDGQVLGPWDITKTPPAYIKAVRNNPGFQNVLGLTDTASAAKYQLVSASLRNPAGAFASPTAEAMTAASAAMTRTAAQAQVYEYNPAGEAAKAAPTAYPLTMPVYAATNPTQNDQATRDSYAAFINYASTKGQEPGTAQGQLPDGYAPLPASWRELSKNAAAAIVAGVSVLPPTVESGDSAVSADDATSAGTGGSSDTPSPTFAGPSASGDPALSLTSGVTPKDHDMSEIASAVPLSLLAGIIAALAVPIIPRLRRRI